jgi:hypothetical protein
VQHRGEHGRGGDNEHACQQGVPATRRIVAAAAQFRRQQVHPDRFARGIGEIRARELRGDVAELRELLVELRARHHHQFDVDLAVATAPEHACVVRHRILRERRLPVDLVAGHRTQALGGSGGQHQLPAQSACGRQQQPARQVGHRIRHRVRIVAGAQQHAAAIHAERAAPGRRQPRGQRAAPPREE